MTTKVYANKSFCQHKIKLKTNKDVLQLDKKSSTIHILNTKITKIDAHVFKKKKKSHTVVRPNKKKKK